MSKTDSLARARQHLEEAYNYQEDEDFKRALYECDDTVELLEGLQQAEARSLLAEAYLLRGAILEEMDRYDEAVEEYEEALRIDPAMEEAQENLAALRGTIAADIEEREETRRFAMGATQKNLATGRDTLPQQAPRLVTIATFSHPLEAHVYRGRLEAAGIPAFVADENTVVANWLYSNVVGGAKLQVWEEDAASAKELIESGESGDEAPSPDEMAESKPEPICPRCGSTDVYYQKYARRLVFASWFFLGFPLPFLTRRWKCERCGHAWKSEEAL